jgi:uncharacterized phage protein (TIGR01671 family)
MREIKFRQAIYINNQFLEWHYWGFIGDKWIAPCIGCSITIEEANKNSFQFTGLRDCNGEEIYEKDVVKLNDRLKFMFSKSNKSKIGYVDYYEPEGGYVILEKLNEFEGEYVRLVGSENGDDYEVGQEQIEVIGNVF